nr:MAG TPA: hypothetical protein [Caudoviricetes sp.]
MKIGSLLGSLFVPGTSLVRGFTSDLRVIYEG